ncbi:MAG: hypothetical protein LC808_34180 [Actinobacteria bacterium]|nr:hypothetical protein [Actinomycetota bacterium]
MSVTRRRRISLACSLILVAGVFSAGTLPASAHETAKPYCGITWGSLPKGAVNTAEAPMFTTRTGRHVCFDRLVFQFTAPGAGYHVRYTDEVLTRGEGRPLSQETAGGALIGVYLVAPAYDQLGHVEYPHRSGDHVADLAGYQTLRDVVYGGSREGVTTFAVGTRARLPFRMFVVDGPGDHSRLVLDIAHRWS